MWVAVAAAVASSLYARGREFTTDADRTQTDRERRLKIEQETLAILRQNRVGLWLLGSGAIMLLCLAGYMLI